MRPTKDEYYMNIAREVASRSTCLRAICGAVIVKDDSIVSTGYNGNPRQYENCCDVGTCPRAKYKPQEGTELCNAVHAEMNALINLCRNSGSNTINSKLYVWFKRLDDSINTYDKPCNNCMKHILNAGIISILNYTEDNEKQQLHSTTIKYHILNTNKIWENIK